MEYPIRKVVMTGGTSGIGRALIEILLKEGVEILILRRKVSTRYMYGDLPKHEKLYEDYCTLEELSDYIPRESDFDVFFHLAWGNTNRDQRDDLALHMQNVAYSCEAAKLAYRCGCHTFIGAGSQAEYGRHDVALKPDTHCVPENAYGIAKLSSCYSTKLLCKKFGIRHIWPRILSGYGICDNYRSVLISTIINCNRGKKIAFTAGQQVWDFVYLDDIANALYLIAKKGRDGINYPIGSGKARPLREYLTILGEKLGILENMEFGKIPYRKTELMHLEADITSLQEDTGWKPKVEFEEGIEKVIEFYNGWEIPKIDKKTVFVSQI